MYCLKCGKQIDNDSIKCPACGCPTENAGEITSDLLNPAENLNKESANGFCTAAIALGIIGIVIGWLLAILGYVFGGSALALALIARSKDHDNPKWRAGLIISIIALVCSIVSSIIGIRMMMLT